jgi:hypothetical protein
MYFSGNCWSSRIFMLMAVIKFPLSLSPSGYMEMWIAFLDRTYLFSHILRWILEGGRQTQPCIWLSVPPLPCWVQGKEGKGIVDAGRIYIYIYVCVGPKSQSQMQSKPTLSVSVYKRVSAWSSKSWQDVSSYAFSFMSCMSRYTISKLTRLNSVAWVRERTMSDRRLSGKLHHAKYTNWNNLEWSRF